MFKRSRHKRQASFVTTKIAGKVTRRSRQARRPAKAMAAGIDAASMARRCQNPSQKNLTRSLREC
ncbi:MAG: hypothetical protein ACJ8IK_16740 [Burkholderiaceae bacterium]